VGTPRRVAGIPERLREPRATHRWPLAAWAVSRVLAAAAWGLMQPMIESGLFSQGGYEPRCPRLSLARLWASPANTRAGPRDSRHGSAAYTYDVRACAAAGAISLTVAVSSGCATQTRYDVTAPTTTTIPSPASGAVVRCTNHGTTAQAKVPAPGAGIGEDADGTNSSAELQLTRNASGVLVVSCRP
jgi:hypothetical protein